MIARRGMIFTLLMICITFVIGCTQPFEDSEKLTPTILVVPTPTISVSAINFERLLSPTTSLPGGFTSGQVFDLKIDPVGMPTLLRAVTQRLDKDETPVASASIRIYKSDVDAQQAFTRIQQQATDEIIKPIKGIGEQAMGGSIAGNMAMLVFNRCQSVVEVTSLASPDMGPITEYAQWLDHHLGSLLCNK